MDTNTQPRYWLIREPGKTHGFATVALDMAGDPAEAEQVWRETADPGIVELFDLYGTAVEAVLVEMRYVGGQPVVTEIGD